ncbi:DUF2071 domain-containing protein [Crossiella cryophila]|uniref:DUF2071 domain-containing protein n=1 Tax=Crossiella cryophila TaxID=43355 RepID=A0A7W7FTB8_9PSEU|nr:DUF2071 domain-containing protein [Crossiella cryophila]MBB4678006.1 hypothetical protein [Crossiella cryophila]
MRMASVVARRLLVNYRVDPAVVARLLPDPLRPRLAGGWAVAGICLVRLAQVRPVGLPAALGLRSENAAHRFAVEWDTPDGVRTGVYLPRRHTDSAIAALVGGRLFPGRHRLAKFTVRETARELEIGCVSGDRRTRVWADVRLSGRFGRSELFGELDQAADFFTCGSGYSATRDPHRLDGVAMQAEQWRFEPVDLIGARSTFFDSLPAGSAALDHALLLRDTPATWTPLPSLRVSSAGQPVQA